MEAKNADLSALKISRETSSGSPEGKKFKIKAVLPWLATIVLIVAVFYYVRAMLLEPAIPVKLATAAWTSPAQTNAVLTASGYVVAQRKASVASKGTGRLAYLGVVEGDRVRKDQIIARLEDSDIVAALEQARAALRVSEADLYDAEQTLSRAKALRDKNLSSQAEYDAADARVKRVRANIDVAKANITAAEVALENMRIRAPFDGTVLTKNADVGEIVAPMAASASSRAAVVTIADMTSLQVEADVSESNIVNIRQDQPCEITLDAYTDLRYEGYVAKIVPTADRAKATVLVKVAFRKYDGRVLPEMSAKVLFLGKEADASTKNAKPMLTVPSSAIVTRNGVQTIFRVQDGKAVAVPVTTGGSIGSFVEIKSGVAAGEKIIASIPEGLNDGSKVKIE